MKTLRFTLLVLAGLHPVWAFCATTNWNTYSSDQTVSDTLVDPAPPNTLLGVRVTAGTVEFTGNNTYSGGTEISGGAFRARNNSAAGNVNGVIVVGEGGDLQVYECDLSNSILMTNGSVLSAEGGTELTDDVNGNITLQGGIAQVRVRGWRQTLALRGVISGPGGLDLASTFLNMYTRPICIYGDNTFTGLVTVGSTGTGFVDLYHANALGTNENTVTVQGGRLYLAAAAGGLHTNKTILVTSGGTFGHTSDLVAGNTLRLNGGTLTFGEITLTFSNSASIILGAGTTSRIDRNYGGTCLQTGVISGSGNLTITSSGGGNSTCLKLYGDNTYSGKTTIETDQGWHGLVQVYNGRAFGSGEVEVAAGGLLDINASVAMTNLFTGNGEIRTGSHVLTVAGGVAPGTNDAIGTLTVANLRFGTDSNGAAYAWQYDGTTNDVLVASTLTFGTARCTAQAEWIGSGAAARGDYVLFRYTGADPVLPEWDVTAPGMGRVWLDAENNCVMISIDPAGTVVIFK